MTGGAEASIASVLAAHRALYDAIETGDIDLMRSLWVDDPAITCLHPNAAVLRGPGAVHRSWAVLMANLGYIQFFLTDVEVAVLPGGRTAVVTCTENILSDGNDDGSFLGGTAVASSVLLLDASGAWRFWSRHASAAPSTTGLESNQP